MRLEVVPFASEHIAGAASLLAARQRAYRAQTPALPAQFDDPAVARVVVENIFGQPGAGGVAALRDGRVAGYLIGVRLLPPPTSTWSMFMQPRAANIPYAGHAVEPEHGGAIYREMYAALAPRWLAAGYYSHYVTVATADRLAFDAWSSLCFGQDLILAVRDAQPVAGPNPSACSIRQAEPDDLEAVFRLASANLRYHASAPIFFPYFPETEADQRASMARLLDDPANRVWLAERDGLAVAITTLQPETDIVGAPEHCTYLQHGYVEPDVRGQGVGAALLAQAMDWARAAGYAHCSLNYMPSNLLSARFWQARGFQPLHRRLFRRVDERVAWAGGQTL
jgi:GNAT superfamily N-acetyltransferase